ncbi:MAG: hypothetical protein A2428_07570 [Bdellovibrionales bacterium RIFOXYC1_FULL_54_43]|nr:MAG: hypothetical protein A2428_07570 [Bdellovibrionales bacterium RIFOXYC1_FULL_54_43]
MVPDPPANASADEKTIATRKNSARELRVMSIPFIFCSANSAKIQGLLRNRFTVIRVPSTQGSHQRHHCSAHGRAISLDQLNVQTPKGQHLVRPVE